MKPKKIETVILISLIAISFFSLLITLATSVSIGLDQDYLDAYSWISSQTDVSRIYDIYIYECVFYTDKPCTFSNLYGSGELWNFWNLKEQDALKLFQREKVNYFILSLDLICSQEKTWICFPKEVIDIQNWSSFEIVYKDGLMRIWRINYE